MINNNEGFTLVEILIVIIIISIMALAVVPRMTVFFNSERENTAITTSLIVKTFDDSFLNGNVNYLSIHLHGPWQQQEDPADSESADIHSRRNAISVLRLVDGKFTQHNRNTLKPRDFPDSFRFEEVVLSTGEVIKTGNILVPFYPAGFSDNIILRILLNDSDKISIKIRKFLREPVVVNGYAEFDEIEAGA
ncbi:MAG: prepilin-type N-terminal cleavage/methylation domain-containing protein [Leptospirales bacterium]|nr:prepilin-type N-terminal cleavage/methylation domain-containing protein [Leptospirales bacterium]